VLLLFLVLSLLLPAAGGAVLFDSFTLDCSCNVFYEGAEAGWSSTEKEVEEDVDDVDDVDDMLLGSLVLACETID